MRPPIVQTSACRWLTRHGGVRLRQLQQPPRVRVLARLMAAVWGVGVVVVLVLEDEWRMCVGGGRQEMVWVV